MYLVARNLHKTYGTASVVRGIDLTVTPGQVVGLLGPNGAGKSTTVGMLYGMVIPTSGDVHLGEWNLHQHGRQVRRLMGVVSQADNLDPDFNVWDNLMCFARHYGMTGRVAREQVGALLKQVGLGDRHDSDIEALSGGLKRRVVLARALINHPKIVFLDEPTTGLDPDARQEFWKLVTQLKLSGCGVLLTTHYMDEAERLCDHLVLLQQGVVVDRGKPQALIDRVVGKGVIEVEGVAEDRLQAIAEAAGTWSRPFSNGYLMAVPSDDAEAFCQQIEYEHPRRYSYRQANLEDVFLRLTGTSL